MFFDVPSQLVRKSLMVFDRKLMVENYTLPLGCLRYRKWQMTSSSNFLNPICSSCPSVHCQYLSNFIVLKLFRLLAGPKIWPLGQKLGFSELLISFVATSDRELTVGTIRRFTTVNIVPINKSGKKSLNSTHSPTWPEPRVGSIATNFGGASISPST